MERSQRSGHCCPELCPPYSSNGNEPRTTVLYGNNSASVTTRSPPFFFFCSIPSLYISLPSKLLNVGLHVEAAHLKQAKNTSERAGKTGERAPQRALHFSQSRSALCTQPIFGAQWQSSRCLRTILSKIGPDSATAVEPRFPVPGGGNSVHFIVRACFLFLTDMNGKGHEVGSKSEWNDLEGPGYGL